MSSVKETVREKSPYKRGADDGVVLGVLLVCIFLAMTIATRSSLAALTGLVLMVVGVPAMTFLCLRRSYMRDNGLTIYSSLWVQGIVMFFCGTLIMALFVYVYLRVLDPTYMVDTLNHVASFYEEQGGAQNQQWALFIHNMIKQNLVPSAISVAIEMIWVGVFTGSLLSALMAAVVKMKMFGLAK